MLPFQIAIDEKVIRLSPVGLIVFGYCLDIIIQEIRLGWPTGYDYKNMLKSV